MDTTATFKLLFDSNPLPMWVYDRDMLHFLEVNDAAVAQYGYSREEFLAMRVTDLQPVEDVARLLRDVETARHALQPSELRHQRKDGQIIDVELASHTFDFNGRPVVLVVAQDVTRRKRAEERSQRQLQRLGALRAIDIAITASLDLRVTLNIFLDQVTTLMNVDAADVLLLNSKTHALEYVVGRGFRGHAVTRRWLRPGEGVAGRVAQTRQPMSVPNLGEAPDSFSRDRLLADEEFHAYFASPLISKGQVKGVLELFHRTPLAPDQEWMEFLEALTGQTAVAIDNAMTLHELQRSSAELVLAYDVTLEGWSRALDLRHREPEGHSQRVAEITLHLARSTGVIEDELIHIYRGALLHDIGKMGIPDSILLKPGPLTDEEWTVMQRHPIYAQELLSPIDYLRPALPIPYCHHERWDGTGYPQGLRGEQIPLAARLFAVADVWDSLREDRPYRRAWSDAEAREYMRGQAGKQFDPGIVEVFFQLLPFQVDSPRPTRHRPPEGTGVPSKLHLRSDLLGRY